LTSKPLRIGQIAPLAESVPPKLYGGTERVVAWLIDELIELGQDVTLFASGDSRTRARLVPVWPRALRLGRPRADPTVAQAALLESVAQRAGDLDVLHCHVDWLHGRLDLPGLPSLVERFPDAPFISISDNQRSPLPQARWLSTVYHGMPPGLLGPSFARGQYLAFLGRLTAEKGPDVAVRIARKSGMPLRIAAKIPRGQKGYFAETISPLVDGDAVQLIGEVNDQTKQEFLANAAALVFPIDWPEPFGLVMIEAMACGTPVIAFRRGSVPEVIENGVTGFVVDTEDEAVEAIGRLPELDRTRVRTAFERRFSARRMAEDYLGQYRFLHSNGSSVSARGTLHVGEPGDPAGKKAVSLQL
jgi:glycosyltransferase involved in cell wall biosynthesis